MIADNESQPAWSKIHEFLDRLFSAMRWIVAREFDPDIHGWLEMDFRFQGGMVPRDLPTYRKLLRNLEAERDGIARAAANRLRVITGEAGDAAVVRPVLDTLAAFPDPRDAALPEGFPQGVGPAEAVGPGACGGSLRGGRPLHALLGATLEAVCDDRCPVLFGPEEVAEVWRWKR